MTKVSNGEINPGETISFDDLRLTQNFEETAGAKKLLTNIPVRKPHKQSYVRAHPDTAYSLDTMVLEMKEDSETYLVSRHLWTELGGELVAVTLTLAVTRQGTVFVWPTKLPDPNGRFNSWNNSAREALEEAKKKVGPNYTEYGYRCL